MKRIVKRVVLGIFSLLVIGIIVILIIKDPILENIAEKQLSEKWGAPVYIDKFHLALLKPGISLQRLTMDHKENPDIYMVKTGFIGIRVRLLPFLLKRIIEVPDITIQDVQFSLAKEGKKIPQEKKEKFQDEKAVVKSIDIEKLVTDYINDFASQISSIATVNTVTAKGEQIVRDTEKIITDTEKDIQNITTDINTLQQQVESIQSIQDLPKLQSLLDQGQKIISYKDTIEQRINSTSQIVEGHAQDITNIANEIGASIEKDAKFIAETVMSPDTLGLDILKNLIRQVLQAPITKYHGVLKQLLNTLEDQTKTTEKEPTEEKEKSTSTQVFVVDVFTINFNNKENMPMLYIQSKNITNQIYTAAPTLFTVEAYAQDITIAGNGNFSLNPDIAEFISADVSFDGVPFDINQHISAVELERITGSLGGTLDVLVRKDNTSTIEAEIKTQTNEIQAIPNTSVGPYLAEAIEKSQPMNISAYIELEGIKITTFTVSDSFTQKLLDYAIEIAQQQLEQSIKEAEAYAKKYLEDNLGDALVIAQEQVDGIESQVSTIIAQSLETTEALNTVVASIENRIGEVGDSLKDNIENAIEGAIQNIIPF